MNAEAKSLLPGCAGLVFGRISRTTLLLCFLGMGCSSASDERDRSTGGAKTVRTTAGVTVHLGPREVLLADNALGLRYFPDEAIALLDRGPPMRLLVSAGDSSYLVEGRDLENLEHASRVLTPGPEGTFDNGYAGTAGAYRDPSGKLYTFYHAEDHNEELPRQAWYYSGWYGSMGVAVSLDAGRSFRKLGPALRSAKPDLDALAGESTWGVAAPSVVVDRTGTYLFAYYTEHSPGSENRGVTIGMARSDISTGEPVPGRWQKYYDGNFGEPGLGGRDTAILEIEPRDEAAYLQPHVVFSAELDRYVMIVNVAWWRETWDNADLSRSGIYIAFSEDGIAWSTPEPLLIEHSLPAFGRSLAWQATIIWDEFSSTEGWLIYAYSESWGPGYFLGTPHYMVGRQIGFKRNAPQN